jgi:glycosyltransferase involved in cell wall biosynthesis
VVLATEQVGERMAGPAIRALNLARQLAARGATVTLATPGAIELEDRTPLEGLQLASFGTPSWRRFRELAEAHDVVVTQPQRVDVAWGLAASGARVIYDLYVPSFAERPAQLATEPIAASLKARLLERDRLEYTTAWALGDGFVCASETQRAHYVDAIGRGAVEVAVVPFGVPDEPPADEPGAVRGALVPEDSIVLLWTGGLWNWFDPVTVVEGLARARAREPRLRLVVMGVHHPEAAWEEQAASHAMRTRAAALGLLEDGGVVLCEQWVPYAERHRFLRDADAGVSAHHVSLETRFSFRTRFLDHLWAGLPTITTGGGELTDRMVEAGAAVAVGEGDVEAWADALVALGSDPGRSAAMRVAAASLAAEYRWSKVTEPLVQLAARSSRGTRRRRPLQLLRYALLLVRIRIQAKGLGSLAAALRGAAGR